MMCERVMSERLEWLKLSSLGWGPLPLFLEVRILKDFKSFVFVSADYEGLTERFSRGVVCGSLLLFTLN